MKYEDRLRDTMEAYAKGVHYIKGYLMRSDVEIDEIERRIDQAIKEAEMVGQDETPRCDLHGTFMPCTICQSWEDDEYCRHGAENGECVECGMEKLNL